VAAIERAHQHVYHLLYCNCEVFALWCRTPWRYNLRLCTSLFFSLHVIQFKLLRKLG
jgi:hypothetical protein